MKTALVSIAFSILIISTNLYSSLLPSSSHKADALHLKYFQEFREEIKSLSSLSSELERDSIESLKIQLIKTRLSFKRIEFFFDHYHTQFSQFNINGGPVFKVNEEDPRAPPIKPNGLQALDELIFSDEVETEFILIDSLAQELQKAVDFIAETYHGTELEDHTIIEAIRSGLVRVFTLGVTGFDTPGSTNALMEAEVSLLKMQEFFQTFEKKTSKESIDKYHSINSIFSLAIKQLQDQTFDDFDRLSFLREAINPLYASLRQFEKLNNIDALESRLHGQNYSANNLMGENFLRREYFQEFSYMPLNNPKSIELGKILFFDPILSQNFKMSCASCHSPQKAFSDGLATSQTNNPGTFTKRNAPTLIDATFSRKYFHDLRTFNLERQIPHVFDNGDEFNIGFPEVVERLKQSNAYRKYFKEIYGNNSSSDDINQRTISNALAAYVNSLVSFNSDFDKYVREETDIYPESAKLGFNIFMGKGACGTCHFPPAFNGTVPPYYTESESEVLGVTIGFDTINPVLDTDYGRYENGRKWDKLPHYKFSFKTPGLRNIELTSPYMHNGSFTSLEDVMAFYNKGGGAGMGLELENQTLAADPLGLTEKETNAVIAFLQTLTDTSGLIPSKFELPAFEENTNWNNRANAH